MLRNQQQSVRNHTLRRAKSITAPRSTSQKRLVSLGGSALCVQEPSPNTPSVLPSMARDATPPQAVLDWVAMPLKAKFNS